LQLDPNYAAAHAGLGLAFWDVAQLGWTEFPDDAIARAEELARKALTIDPENLDAHRLLARVNSARFKPHVALIQVDRALALNSSDSESQATRGEALLWLGRVDEAITALETAFALNPNQSEHDVVRFLEREALRNPSIVFIQVVLAAAYAQLGRADDAQRVADLVRRRLPVFDPQIFGSRFQSPADHRYLVEGLRKAGLT